MRSGKDAKKHTHFDANELIQCASSAQPFHMLGLYSVEYIRNNRNFKFKDEGQGPTMR